MSLACPSFIYIVNYLLNEIIKKRDHMLVLLELCFPNEVEVHDRHNL